jgi:hypothetical protein
MKQITTWLAVLLLALSASAAMEYAPPSVQIDWPAFLAKQDPQQPHAPPHLPRVDRPDQAADRAIGTRRFLNQQSMRQQEGHFSPANF